MFKSSKLSHYKVLFNTWGGVTLCSILAPWWTHAFYWDDVYIFLLVQSETNLGCVLQAFMNASGFAYVTSVVYLYVTKMKGSSPV